MNRVGPFDPVSLAVTFGSSAFSNWANANPGAGVEGSIPGFQAWTHAMEEIARVIEAAGMTPSQSDLSQLLKAIGRIKVDGLAVFFSNDTFVVPANVTRIRGTAVGGGGGGGGSGAGGAGSGGGSSSRARGNYTVTPGQSLAITIGLGGVPGSAGGGIAGSDGGTSSIGALLSVPGGKAGLNAGAGLTAAGASFPAAPSGAAEWWPGIGTVPSLILDATPLASMGASAPGGTSSPGHIPAGTPGYANFPGGGGSGGPNGEAGTAGTAGIVIIEW